MTDWFRAIVLATVIAFGGAMVAVVAPSAADTATTTVTTPTDAGVHIDPYTLPCAPYDAGSGAGQSSSYGHGYYTCACDYGYGYGSGSGYTGSDRSYYVCAPAAGTGLGTGFPRHKRETAAAEPVAAAAPLPFTGYDVLLAVLLAGGLLAMGVSGRRLTHR